MHLLILCQLDFTTVGVRIHELATLFLAEQAIRYRLTRRNSVFVLAAKLYTYNRRDTARIQVVGHNAYVYTGPKTNT